MMRKFAGVLVVIAISAAIGVRRHEAGDCDSRLHDSGVIKAVRIQSSGLQFTLGENRYYTDDRDPALNLAILAACAHEIHVRIGFAAQQALRQEPEPEQSSGIRQATSCRCVASGPLSEIVPKLQFELLKLSIPLILAAEQKV